MDRKTEKEMDRKTERQRERQKDTQGERLVAPRSTDSGLAMLRFTAMTPLATSGEVGEREKDGMRAGGRLCCIWRLM